MLLLEAVDRPLVLTSGNLTDEPIAFEDGDAQRRLAPVADAFLAHDRPIHIRCDDSVLRVVRDAGYPIRRARSYAPEPLTVATRFIKPTLATGAELKNTFCLGFEDRAVLSPHVGDLKNWESLEAFRSGIEHLQGLYDVEPEIVVHDLHPDYLTTRWARALDGVERIEVQHHHAHIASCLADNRRSETVIGLALDGAGFGSDGQVWGCEVLVCDLVSCRRSAALRPLPLPGGDAAAREPWRMAAVYLQAAFGPEAAELPLDFVARNAARWDLVWQMAAQGINSPPTTSAGRLFDAAAALCGVRDRNAYEGQAAAELEQLADPDLDLAYPCAVEGSTIDGVELIAALTDDLVSGRAREAAAAAFHNGLAGALVESCDRARSAAGVNTVALSGGTWQNVLLLERTRHELESRGFEVLVHRRVPCNDGGLSLGQAAIAAARAAR